MTLAFGFGEPPGDLFDAAYTRVMAQLEAREPGFSIDEDLQRHLAALARQRGVSLRELLIGAFGEPARRPDPRDRQAQALRFRAALARINAELGEEEFERRFEEYWPERAAEARGEGPGSTA
ncbi:hypothetical protein [Actinocorallia populi]|uniref:hypothetical protein n=1 Tax=Actinocorallia populi TaxID=2079200 RepID=UPI000D08FE2E|nr:hypothetical protein [Actinocorallia populi]